MSRAALLGSLILLLVLAGLAGLRGALLALAMPLLVYFFYGLWRGPDQIMLDVQRVIDADRVTPHTPVKVSVTITNRGNALDELAIEDAVSPALTVANGSNHHLISLPKGRSFSFEFSVSGPRGGFPFETVHTEAGDDLGLMRVLRDFPTSGTLFVLPNISRIRYVPIRPRRTRVYAGAIPARVG